MICLYMEQYGICPTRHLQKGYSRVHETAESPDLPWEDQSSATHEDCYEEDSWGDLALPDNNSVWGHEEEASPHAASQEGDYLWDDDGYPYNEAAYEDFARNWAEEQALEEASYCPDGYINDDRDETDDDFDQVSSFAPKILQVCIEYIRY